MKERAQKKVVALGGAVQFGLLAAALADIYQRPAEQIRGGKLPWTLASFANFVGPLSYFFFGRKRVSPRHQHPGRHRAG
ncbi:PLDc_N domain-containing protein [Rubrobacter taiwanensis]|uniref:PLDc_N domain-containing protein n=1 Tax=Rubrobacter taiwanensis TaxID=185139 RepID=A0A4R1BHA7_9ACTN|nr:PLDc_N domain-containing protein [Rubrobacter taiwanensis]